MLNLTGHPLNPLPRRGLTGCRIKVWPLFDKLLNKNFDRRHLNIGLASNWASPGPEKSLSNELKPYLVCVLTDCSYWLVICLWNVVWFH